MNINYVQMWDLFRVWNHEETFLGDPKLSDAWRAAWEKSAALHLDRINQLEDQVRELEYVLGTLLDETGPKRPR